MKKYLFFIFAGIFFCISNYVDATQYVSVNLGTNYGQLKNETKSGQKIGVKTGVAYGYHFGQGFRGELEWCYRNNPYKSRSELTNDKNAPVTSTRTAKSFSYMANVIYDLSQLDYKTITPFIGAGAGYSKHDDKYKTKTTLTSSTSTLKDNGFVYQGIVGMKFPFSDGSDIAATYHYFIGRAHQKHHSVSLSLAKKF